MTMKVSKRDITILLIALGGILAFCVFQFYFRKAMDEKKNYDAESATLQERLEKNVYNVDEDKLRSEMAKMEEALKEGIKDDKGNIIVRGAKDYPSEYSYENLILYLNEWQLLPYEEMYNFPKYALTETLYDKNISGTINWNQENHTEITTSYWFGLSAIDTLYGTNSYKAFKDMINKIYLDPSPKTIQSITAKMDATNGFVSGKVMIYFWNVQNGSNEPAPVTKPTVETKIPNIFGPTNTPTPTPTPTPRPGRNTENNN
ncbi:MAG: hypothetical protein J5845_07430 [Lachnospiraceae bacterium]|nr:hypothetical protein [Lachnospiraceae bacterium]